MPMTGMETAQRNGTMPEAVRATAMMKTEILQKNRFSVMLSMRTTKPCVTATAETEACSGKRMPKDPYRNHTGNYRVPLQWTALRQQHQRPGGKYKTGRTGQPRKLKEMILIGIWLEQLKQRKEEV